MRRAEFIHISDIHYQRRYSPFARRLIEKTGADFTSLFRRNMAHILQRHENIDFFLISGDLVHEGTIDEYRELRELWDEICGLPVYAVPGNHDSQAFASGFLGEEPMEPGEPTDRIYCHDSGLRIIAADARGGAYGTGRLSPTQLIRLREAVSEPGDAIFMLHQTPHVSGDEEFLIWQMENPGEVYEAVRESQLLGIFAGHTHKRFYSELGCIPCYTVDSITHGIEVGEDAMTVSNQAGYHHCLYEDGKLTVRYEAIFVMPYVEVRIPYSEFGAEEGST